MPTFRTLGKHVALPCHCNDLRRGIKSRFLEFFVRANSDKFFCATVLGLSILLSACGNRSNAVSGAIEVDEVHVGPRSGGRIDKIFAWEGDKLRGGIFSCRV
jgi:hypothetical protein